MWHGAASLVVLAELPALLLPDSCTQSKHGLYAEKQLGKDFLLTTVKDMTN